MAIGRRELINGLKTKMYELVNTRTYIENIHSMVYNKNVCYALHYNGNNRRIIRLQLKTISK